jgi:uncharacterized peroxidase-related enzyme
MIEDLIDTLAALPPDSALARLRHERAAIRGHTQGAYRALLHPEQPGGLSRQARAALAWRCAVDERDGPLAAHFAGLGGGEAEGVLAEYGRRVATAPGGIRQGDIDALRAAGLSPQDIVAATQLVAFVPFQVRLLAGLRAMAGHPPTETAGLPQKAAAAFTMAEVGWSPRVPPVDAATATEAQLAALEACPPAQRRSTYFLTLALDPASLEERGALFNSVMYAPRGLKRAERELATAVVSMVNGCVYCCSVHARRFAELTGEAEAMQRLLDEGFGTALDPRRRAIVDVSAKLTATPGALAAEDMAALRAAGLEALEVLDLVHAVAMFANANRLMQALGDSRPPAG